MPFAYHLFIIGNKDNRLRLTIRLFGGVAHHTCPQISKWNAVRSDNRYIRYALSRKLYSLNAVDARPLMGSS